MSSEKVTLEFRHIAPWPWAEKEKAAELLDIFEQATNHHLDLKRYGTSELRTFPIEGNNERFLELWMDKRYCILKSPKPWNVLISVMMYPVGASSINLWIDDLFFDVEMRLNGFLDLAKRLYLWGDMDHGYIAHKDEYLEKNTYYVGPHIVHGGGRLEQSLPGVYWANFFGPRYVEWFGKRKFETLPAFYKEELDDGGWLILARSKPIDIRHDAARQLERAIIVHLGEDAFFDNSQPEKPTISPPFAQREVSD